MPAPGGAPAMCQVLTCPPIRRSLTAFALGLDLCRDLGRRQESRQMWSPPSQSSCAGEVDGVKKPSNRCSHDAMRCVPWRTPEKARTQLCPLVRSSKPPYIDKKAFLQAHFTAKQTKAQGTNLFQPHAWKMAEPGFPRVAGRRELWLVLSASPRFPPDEEGLSVNKGDPRPRPWR